MQAPGRHIGVSNLAGSLPGRQIQAVSRRHAARVIEDERRRLEPANQSDLDLWKIVRIVECHHGEVLTNQSRNGWIERYLRQAERSHADASAEHAEIPLASETNGIPKRHGFQQ